MRKAIEELFPLHEKYERFSELKKTAAHQSFEEISAANTMIYIFSSNHKILSDILENNSSIEACYRLIENRDELKKVHLQVTQHFLNLIHSAFSLRDISRILSKKTELLSPNVITENKSKIETNFINRNVVKFIEELRNIMTHHSLIPSTLATISTLGKFSGGFCFQDKTLLEFDRFGSVSKGYIKSSGEKIFLSSITDEYADLVLSYQSWFVSELFSHHKNMHPEYWDVRNAISFNWDGDIPIYQHHK